MRSISLTAVAAAAAAFTLLAPSAVRAQEWESDVRFRAGVFSPLDLPTHAGAYWGFEYRNLMTDRDGILFGIYLYDEQREETRTLAFGGAPTEFTFRAEVKMQPILVSWFHIWPRSTVTWYGGAGVGLYPTDALSGGFSLQAGVQITDVGDFRPLEDDTLFGGHVFGGIDLFPDSRWGFMAEGRFHVVQDSYSGSEVSIGAILRF